MKQQLQNKNQKLLNSLLRIIGGLILLLSFLTIPIIVISGFLVPFIASFIGPLIIYYFVLIISGGLSLFLFGLSLISFGELENIKKSTLSANLLGIIQLILGSIIFLASIITIYLLFRTEIIIGNIILYPVLLLTLSMCNILFGFHLRKKYGLSKNIPN